VPTSQLTYTDDDFVKIATETLLDEVVPLVMSTREEYFVDHVDVSTAADGIIDIPDYCVGSKLRSVCYMVQSSPLVLTNLPRIDLDVVAGVGFNNYNVLSGFYVQNNSLVLYPNQSVQAGTNIRLYYYKRVLSLAKPAAYCQINSIDTVAKSVVVDVVPAAWAIDTVVNAVSSVQGFKTVNEKMTITAVSSPTIFFDNVDNLSVGDYLSIQGYSAIPQIPVEAHGYLAQLSAVRVLEGQADAQGLQIASDRAEKLKRDLLVMISQRVDGSVRKIMNPNGGLRLGSGLGRWSRGWTGVS
jgi:hypothetical protein